MRERASICELFEAKDLERIEQIWAFRETDQERRLRFACRLVCFPILMPKQAAFWFAPVIS